MQVWFQVAPPSDDASKPRTDEQLKSLPPVSRSWSLMGLAAIGSSSTGFPPSEAWALGRAQGVGEQVGVPDAAARAAAAPPGFTWPAWTARAARTPPDKGLRGRWKRLSALPADPAPAESVGSAARAPTRSRLR